jgi:hypothetical protein
MISNSSGSRHFKIRLLKTITLGLAIQITESLPGNFKSYQLEKLGMNRV